uniref:Uncharacterized protein n=1 Tax=Opuntia streptacantha TaxID=393608 RepID=A0A7C9AR41_OPUST
MLIHRQSIIRNLNTANIAISLLEEVTSIKQREEMAEAEVRGGAMAAECVEVAATDEDELRHAESGGAAGQCAHVVAFGYVVHQYIALYAIFFAHFLGAGLPTGVRSAGQMGFFVGFR